MLNNINHDILETDLPLLEVITKYNLKTTNKIITEDDKTDMKKLYIDKMITMFKEKAMETQSLPTWDSDSEDNASTDDGINEEDC